jgi:hypothetical protein
MRIHLGRSILASCSSEPTALSSLVADRTVASLRAKRFDIFSCCLSSLLFFLALIGWLSAPFQHPFLTNEKAADPS